MRRLLCLCGLACLFCLLCGCTHDGAREAPAGLLKVYYRAEPDGLEAGSTIIGVTYSLGPEADRLHEALRRIMGTPPPPEGQRSAFPNELHIDTYTLSDGELQVVMSAGYAGMPPLERTLARCCLVLTLCGLEEVDSVSIYEEERLLEERLTPDILLAESLAEEDYQTELTLWFPDSALESLHAEQRTLSAARVRPLAERAVAELLRGTKSAGLRAAFPVGTVLRSVQVREGLCTVDLSEDFYRSRPRSAALERLCIYALVNTMTELPAVDRVRITVEGDPVGLYTTLDLREPLQRAEEFSADYLEGRNWVTTRLYLPTSDGRLAEVPIRLELRDLGDAVRASLEYLLSLEFCWGYRRAAPTGTRLLHCAVSDGVAELTLSGAFAGADEETQRLCAKALAATAVEAGDLRGIRIHVEGHPYQNGDLIGKDRDLIAER